MGNPAHRLKEHYGGYRGTRASVHDVSADTSTIKILPEVDPRNDITNELGIYNQGELGSCTANATSKAVDYSRLQDGEQSVQPARLAIYWEERRIENQPEDEDTGAEGRDGLLACQSVGYWPESEIPYSDDMNDADFYTDPLKQHGPAPYKLTDHFKAVPRRVNDFKAVFSNRQTVCLGFTVYESFESPEVARTGIMPIPGRDEKILGGHEVLAIGYLKSEPHYCLVTNSWGTDWGIDGFFLMPWAVLLDPTMSDDFRTIQRPVGK